MVSRHKVDEIVNLHVHKGKDPILELEFGGGGKGSSEKLHFMCDFSRQLFISKLVDVKNGAFDKDESGSSQTDDDF